MEKTWDEIKSLPEGTILKDTFDEGVRFLIIRGPSAVCAYLGIPKDHPLAGFDYEDINVTAHGGLTFAGDGDHYRPEGFYWYGWDYAHSGDYCFYDDKFPSRYKERSTKWTVEQVEKDSWGTIYEFKKLMRFAEKVVANVNKQPKTTNA